MSASESKPRAHLRLPGDLGADGDGHPLVERVRRLLAMSGAEHVVCDVDGIECPDLGTASALARLQLEARRNGGRIELRHASEDLRNLLALMGLDAVLPCVDESVVEVGREAEEREPARGVEEEGDAADPSA
jgi:ABC-type transporter Mla MlaB component